jgi:hypothetical protein
MTYDIFISYRRDGGFATANLIATKLSHAGYSVFFDVEEMRSGKFNEQLYRHIEQCKDVVLVLPAGALDRCENEEDWLRKEIVHARRSGKNVIPVLLRGFEWPTKFPDGLEELNLYQGVTASEHSLFDASIQMLKKYLRSRPGYWRKLFRAGVAFGIFAALLGAAFFGFRQMAIPVCAEQAAAMTLKMTRVDILTQDMIKLGDVWNTFYREYKDALPDKQKDLAAEMRARIAHVRKEFPAPRSADNPLQFSTFQRLCFQIYAIDIAEFSAFHNAFYPQTFTEAAEHLDIMDGFLDFDGGVPELSIENSKVNVEFSKHIANAVYFGYMGILSTMPNGARKVYYDNSPSWAYFSSAFKEIDFSREPAFYEQRIKTEMAELERLTSSVARLTTQSLHELHNAQKELNKKKRELEERQDAAAQEAARARTAQTLQNIQKLVAGNMERQRALQEMEKKIEDAIRRNLEKDKPAPGDEQWREWGKIVRTATSMAQTAERRRNMERENAAKKAVALQKGYDVTAGFEIKYTLTMDEVLAVIQQRLDAHGKRFPDAAAYIPAAKQFYTEVRKGTYPIGGLLVTGTENAVAHPIYKTGDIIISRKGASIRMSADYEKAGQSTGAAASTSAADTVTFLRLGTDGTFKVLTEPLPLSAVKTALLQLKYE